VDGVKVTPKAGLHYVHLSERSFVESGAPGFNLAVSGRDTNSLRPFIGVSAAKSFLTTNGLVLTPRADFAWTHEVLSTARQSIVAVGGGVFTVVGLNPARDLFTLGGGV